MRGFYRISKSGSFIKSQPKCVRKKSTNCADGFVGATGGNGKRIRTMLLDTLKEDLTSAMKQGNAVAVETIRFLLAAVRNAAIETYGNKGEAAMTDADIGDVVKKQVKTHKESIEAFQKAGRVDLVTKEQAQLAVLEGYMPTQLTDEELKKLLTGVVASGEKNFGLLMKAAMGKVGGGADGGRVAALLKQVLQK